MSPRWLRLVLAVPPRSETERSRAEATVTALALPMRCHTCFVRLDQPQRLAGLIRAHMR